MIYFAYSLLLAFTLIAGTPYWLFQMIVRGKYRRGLKERLGFVPRRLIEPARPAIWVHAVSVGELLAVSELAARLRSEFPDRRILISTTTETGQRLAEAKFGAQNVFYFPLDFRWVMRRYFSRLRPELVVVAETELWPNFFAAAHQARAAVVVVNARISDRSLPGYRRLRRLAEKFLSGVDLFLAQTEGDRRRLIEIGAPRERIEVTGNLKFDLVAPAELPIVDQIRSGLRAAEAGPVVVAGSTVEGEEPLVLAAFDDVVDRFPRAVLLLAPRHPERFEEVARLLERRGLRFRRRSRFEPGAISCGVLLIDSIGELRSLYALADVAFVGGSLVGRGGHSMIEPAQHGVAIVVGRHTENFRDLVERLEHKQAICVAGSENFSSVLVELLANPQERTSMGRRAREVLEEQRGSTERTIERLRRFIGHLAEAKWA